MVEYAYPSVAAALRAAFSPAEPHYGSGSLRSYSGHTSSPSDLNPLDRTAQACIVYAMLSRELRAEKFAMLAAKFLPAESEEQMEAKVTYANTVAKRLARDSGTRDDLALDVVFRIIGLEPAGHYSYDWARWLEVSPATVYRHADKVKKAWFAEMDALFDRLAVQFDTLHIAPL